MQPESRDCPSCPRRPSYRGIFLSSLPSALSVSFCPLLPNPHLFSFFLLLLPLKTVALAWTPPHPRPTPVSPPTAATGLAHLNSAEAPLPVCGDGVRWWVFPGCGHRGSASLQHWSVSQCLENACRDPSPLLLEAAGSWCPPCVGENVGPGRDGASFSVSF